MKNKLITAILCIITLLIFISGCSTSNDMKQNSDSTGNSSSEAITNEKSLPSATIAIRCDAVFNHYDDLDESLKNDKFVPSDGYILHETKYSLEKDETAYDLLVRATKENKIPLDSENAAASAFGTAYIKGINSLYEKSCGDFSGWMYIVNGEMLNVGSSEFILNDNDIVEFIYVCDYNTDLSIYTKTQNSSDNIADTLAPVS